MPSGIELVLSQEARQYEQQIQMESSKVFHARTMLDLARIVRGTVSPRSYLKVIVSRTTNAFRSAYEQKAKEIVERDLINLSKAESDEQFQQLSARFLKETLEYCRGYFPQAYRQAEIGLARARKDREIPRQTIRERG